MVASVFCSAFLGICSEWFLGCFYAVTKAHSSAVFLGCCCVITKVARTLLGEC